MIPEENPADVERDLRAADRGGGARRSPACAVEVRRILLAQPLRPLPGHERLAEAHRARRPATCSASASRPTACRSIPTRGTTREPASRSCSTAPARARILEANAHRADENLPLVGSAQGDRGRCARACGSAIAVGLQFGVCFAYDSRAAALVLSSEHVAPATLSTLRRPPHPRPLPRGERERARGATRIPVEARADWSNRLRGSSTSLAAASSEAPLIFPLIPLRGGSAREVQLVSQ